VGITIRDVAAAAGVSTATVSRALRGLPNVDGETRERVKRIASSLDYVISPSASRLASGRTGSIAVITPYIARWFFSEVIAGAESVMQQAGMDLLLMNVGDYQDGGSRIPPTLRIRRRVDGILIVALPPQDPDLESIVNLGMPTAMIGGITPGIDCVVIDDVAAARKATEYLISLGHSRIALISGKSGAARFTAGSQRERGYRAVMAEHSLVEDPMLEVSGHFTIEGGESGMDALLNQLNPPTAVFAMSDEMAFGAIRSLRTHGLEPGRDVSIVGIDDHPMSSYLGLTTIAQPVADLGKKAGERLLVQLAGSDSLGGNDRVTQLPTELMVRSSTGMKGFP
jgi:LacI family transcriptional regulator, repressor for deo operon, udp, cdd, tsx, nupC, and nupG